MKTKITQYIKVIILVFALTLGMGYVLANFTPPHSTPPTCVTDPTSANYDPGCLTPINVGPAQTKTGSLTLGGLGILGDFKFIPLSGIHPTAGQVLGATDTLGSVGWTSAGIPSLIAFSSNTTWGPVPAGVTKIRVRVVGGGGGGAVGPCTNTSDLAGTTGHGSSGGYAESVLSVTPNQTFVVNVGNGGLSGGNGVESSFGGVVSAGGGLRGVCGTFTSSGIGSDGEIQTPPSNYESVNMYGYGSGGVISRSGSHGVVVVEY